MGLLRLYGLCVAHGTNKGLVLQAMQYGVEVHGGTRAALNRRPQGAGTEG